MYKIFHDLFPKRITNIYRKLSRLHIRPCETRFDRVNFSVCDTVNSNNRKFFIFHSDLSE